jgi:hypothetical protein
MRQKRNQELLDQLGTKGTGGSLWLLQEFGLRHLTTGRRHPR